MQTPPITSLGDIFTLLEEDLKKSQNNIQSHLETHLPFLTEVLPHLMKMYKPSLRAVTLFLSSRMFSYSGSQIYDIASVLEYLRTATSLHQKIIVTEELRRQQKELLSIWGNEASVLLGDYLLSISFQTMTKLGDLELLKTISDATKAIAKGQILSISQFDWQAAEAHYLKTIELQKASLFIAAGKSAAILGEASLDTQQTLAHYGRNLSIAVQMQKDLNSLQSSKHFQARLNQNHLIFPLVCLMQRLHSKGQQTFLESLLKLPRLSEEQAESILASLDNENIPHYVENSIKDFQKSALGNLKSLTSTDPSLLQSLTHYAVSGISN